MHEKNGQLKMTTSSVNYNLYSQVCYAGHITSSEAETTHLI